MARDPRNARRKQQQLASGVLRLTRQGYGFVNTSEGEYLVFASKLNGAMDGDLVEVARLRSLEQQLSSQQQRHRQPRNQQSGSQQRGQQPNNRRLGAVMHVLDHKHKEVIGELIESQGLRIVRPLDQRINHDVFIDNRLVSRPAKVGDIVVVQITTWPSRIEVASGFISEVLDDLDDSGLTSEVICRKHDIRTQFSAASLEEAQAFSVKTIEPDDGYLHRRDLRDTFVFTIDPADAKDFDDALSIEFVQGDLLLGVHIADVSAYVGLDSALDIEARTRATSVYLPGRVVPMLPAELSEDLCSLVPKADRLAFSVMMQISQNGSVDKVDFFPSIICSQVRLSYEQADAILAGTTGIEIDNTVPEQLKPALLSLDRLARRLRRRRLARGAIDFDSVEPKIVLDDDGHPLAVDLRQRTPATALVEEAMILANEQVAAYMLDHKAPMLYRVHEDPLPLSMQEAIETLYQLGFISSSVVPQDSHAVQAILAACVGHPEYSLVSQLMLRAMKRARYSPHYTGHYGLASPAYCHFTSPIRRYPDLLTHHLLKLKLAGLKPPPGLVAGLEATSEFCSEKEYAAESASREAVHLKLVEYMSARLGQQFAAIITGVEQVGLFVREVTTTAEGLIPADSLPAGFLFESEAHHYYDYIKQQELRLGQTITVMLVKADLRQGLLDFGTPQ
ncbi:MAG: VacB/RNase II family 3'-5' exoribonuclease [Coriobacteriales bacterium]|nr:VacB/RNase II family 3'-5' exoribonuclease [Coriobacteriales bacterium]